MNKESLNFRGNPAQETDENIDVVEIAKAVSKDEGGEISLIPERVQIVEHSFDIVKHIIKGENLRVTKIIGEPYPSMGSISIAGDRIRVSDAASFAQVLELASNFEMYPKTDGTIQAIFTFHNLTRKAGD